MHIIAVSNQKGGVGKTSTALSLASELALQKRRVLAIDMDPQCNLTQGLGLDEGGPGPSLYEVLTTRIAPAEAIRRVPHPGLETLGVMPAGPILARAEPELMGQVGFDELLKHKLRAVEGEWDYVILDCPPSLGALTINGISAASVVVVPVQCEYFSARGVVKLLDVIDLVRERRNPSLRLRILPTLYDRRNNICRAVLAELKQEFTHEVSQVTVGIDTRMRESQAHATPICLYSPRSRSSVAYAALAQEVTGLLEEGGRRVQAA